MKKTTLAIGAALALAAGQASAAIISFYGNDPTSGPMGNVLNYSFDGIDLEVSALAMIDGTTPWEDAYVGRYPGGLGVTNSQDGSHTIDNYGSVDGVVFSFSQSVVMDWVYTTTFRDTDFSLFYLSGGSWTFLENEFGGNSSGWQNVNGGALSAETWLIAANIDHENDKFKIKKILVQPDGPPPGRVPDTGGSLLLLAIGLGALRVMTLKK